MHKCERLFFCGVLASIGWDFSQLYFAYPNAVLVLTATLSIAVGILGLAAELRDWKIKDWWVSFYFIPALLLGAGITTLFYDLLDFGLSLASATPLSRPIAKADYSAELVSHFATLGLVPAVWVLAVVARWRKWC